MLFNRIVEVLIGEPGQENIFIPNEFRVVFNITKTIKEDINSCQLNIYNLKQETRDKILKPGFRVIIQAGYSNAEIISISDIIRSNIKYDIPDIITEIEAGDGARADIDIDLSFEAGRPVSDVLDIVSGKLGLPVRDTGVEVNGEYLQGVSFSGSAKTALTRITRKANLTWSIQDGQLQILSSKGTANNRAIVLNKTTGLVNRPEKLDSLQFNENNENAGYKIKSLLNPKLEPGGIVFVESESLTGQFKINTVRHYGDNRGSQWNTEAEIYEQSE